MEFGLNVNIEEVLESIGLEGTQIDYLLFCKLFDTPIFEDNKSLHSYFSVCNSLFSIKFLDNEGGFERSFTDFEKFMG